MRGLTDTLERAAAHQRLVFLCSFQKEESVIVDELVRAAPHARIVTIDTGVLFPETLQTWKAFEDRFGVQVDVEDASGAWTGPENCCGDAKVAALERALEGAEAWITGIRREQSETRANVALLPAASSASGIVASAARSSSADGIGSPCGSSSGFPSALAIRRSTSSER